VQLAPVGHLRRGKQQVEEQRRRCGKRSGGSAGGRETRLADVLQGVARLMAIARHFRTTLLFVPLDR
jgi:hypothetical protein